MAAAVNRPLLHRMRAKIVPATPPKATEEEGQRVLPKAVQVIIYTACLHSALYDLQDEMESIGQYRHSKKKWLKEATDKIGYIHNALYKSIGGYSPLFGRWYNTQLEVAEQTISECVLLDPPHRAYNIAMALFRMTDKANEGCGRWRCPAVVAHLPEALKLVQRCEFPVEDKQIDFILESQIDTNNLTKKIEDKL